MTALQEHIIKNLNAQPTINPEEEIRNRVEFLKQFVVNAGRKGFVLGISGGQDSCLAGKLCQIAVNELNTEANAAKYIFLPVLLPYKTQKDAVDAELAIKYITEGATTGTAFNIAEPVDAFVNAYNTATDTNLSDYAKGNVKARMRMIAQYALAGELDLLVVSTDQNCEFLAGFYTKWGDQGADLAPISGLNKRQGKELLKHLDAPDIFYTKKPTADLLDETPAQPDETELGITYNQIDDYLEGKNVGNDVANKIENRYFITEHKRQMPATPTDMWWK